MEKRRSGRIMPSQSQKNGEAIIRIEGDLKLPVQVLGKIEVVEHLYTWPGRKHHS